MANPPYRDFTNIVDENGNIVGFGRAIYPSLSYPDNVGLPTQPPVDKEGNLIPQLPTGVRIEPELDKVSKFTEHVRKVAEKEVVTGNANLTNINPGFAAGEYKFPHDVGQQHIPDYMVFYFLDLMKPDGSWVNDDWSDATMATGKAYVDASKATRSTQTGTLGGNLNLSKATTEAVTNGVVNFVAGGVKAVVSDATDEQVNKTAEEIKSSVKNFAGRGDEYKITGDSIKIMMPSSVEFNDGAGWQAVNATPTGLGLLANVALTDTKLGDVGGYEINRMITSILYEDGAGAASATVKKVLNPFVAQAFESMARRQFRFSWVVTPKNEDELANVKAIIQLFRFHMHPTLDATKAFLRYPSQVDIKFMATPLGGQPEENSWLPKVTTCVIKDFSSNYTVNGQWSTVDANKPGAPYQFQFTVTLEEIVPLVKQDILGGY